MAKLDLNDGQFRPSIDGIENGKTSQVTGMNRILNFIQGNINYLKSLVDSKANKTIQVIAGNGLVGGGDLSTNRTLNVASADDGITVNADNIKLNIVDNATTDSATRAGSARQIKLLSENKQNKTDSGLQTDSKEIVGAINESLWHTKPKSVGNTSTQSDLNDLTDLGFYRSQSANNLWLNLPNNLTKASFFLEVIGGNVEFGIIHQIISFTVNNTRYIRWGNKNTTGGGKPNEWSEWQQILTSNNKLFLGNAGISKVIYIQDAGQKTVGNGYVDKTTGQLYLCKTTNSDTSVTSNFVLATNIEIAKRQHFTKTILFDKPTGHVSGAITLSDNWENYDEFIVYGSDDAIDYVGPYRFKKEDIEYSISKGQRYMIYNGANDYWIVKITNGSKTWASGSGDHWENCAIFRIIGIKYGG